VCCIANEHFVYMNLWLRLRRTGTVRRPAASVREPGSPFGRPLDKGDGEHRQSRYGDGGDSADEGGAVEKGTHVEDILRAQDVRSIGRECGDSRGHLRWLLLQEALGVDCSKVCRDDQHAVQQMGEDTTRRARVQRSERRQQPDDLQVVQHEGRSGNPRSQMRSVVVNRPEVECQSGRDEGGSDDDPEDSRRGVRAADVPGERGSTTQG
jgi:hypothetical protein